MAELHDKIRAALADRKMNLRKVSQEANLNYTTLHSGMQKERNLPFETIDALAGALGVSVTYFSNRNSTLSVDEFEMNNTIHERALGILNNALKSTTRQISYSGLEIGLEDFLNWWHANNGRLEGFDGLADFVDLFDEPDCNVSQIAPCVIGRKSLATICFDSSDVEDLRNTLAGFSSQTNDQLLSAHLTALNTGEPVITHPTLSETLRNGSHFDRKYRRVLAPIHLPNGGRMVANFSQDIVSPKVRKKQVV